MANFSRNNLLKYIPKNIKVESDVNTLRIFEYNDKPIKNLKDGYIIYLCEREVRLKDNFALQFVIKKSEELKLDIKIIHPKKNYANNVKDKFINKNVLKAKDDFYKMGLDFEIIDKKDLLKFLKNTKISCLVFDFNPISDITLFNTLDFKIYEVDGHNIIPARVISDRQEYNAATFRRKVYGNIYEYFTEFDSKSNIDTESDFELDNFVKNKLDFYSELKNNPTQDVTSGLSKYLNFGFISSQRVALEVIKSKSSDENKEAFLEELIVRKELADNFCLYCNNFKTLKCVPNWVMYSLAFHKKDIRNYLYSLQDFENAKTHDKLWNASQIQLIREGRIHGYLRMYWAKKIMEWTFSIRDALDIAIYLNDKYAFDAPSASGYVGILWAIAGVHDRAFVDSPITGKIRRMTFNSISKKFDVDEYINRYEN
ncbi:MAG: hypothetical protein ACI37S_03645 [Candidatus Gastranaerophilaceae bacterium]